MDSERKRYAVGDFGKLYQFQGGDIPDGATPLVEEHDDSLTAAGKSYCEKRAKPVSIESIRVLFAQQSSSAVTEAATASVRNQEALQERSEKTKAMSERLRHDWEAQDKAYKASAAAKKVG